jgi:hypothetical protein
MVIVSIYQAYCHHLILGQVNNVLDLGSNKDHSRLDHFMDLVMF